MDLASQYIQAREEDMGKIEPPSLRLAIFDFKSSPTQTCLYDSRYCRWPVEEFNLIITDEILFLPKVCGPERDLHWAFGGIVETSEPGKMTLRKVLIKLKSFERLLNWISDLLPNCYVIPFWMHKIQICTKFFPDACLTPSSKSSLSQKQTNVLDFTLSLKERAWNPSQIYLCD